MRVFNAEKWPTRMVTDEAALAYACYEIEYPTPDEGIALHAGCTQDEQEARRWLEGEPVDLFRPFSQERLDAARKELAP